MLPYLIVNYFGNCNLRNSKHLSNLYLSMRILHCQNLNNLFVS